MPGNYLIRVSRRNKIHKDLCVCAMPSKRSISIERLVCPSSTEVFGRTTSCTPFGRTAPLSLLGVQLSSCSSPMPRYRVRFAGRLADLSFGGRRLSIGLSQTSNCCMQRMPPTRTPFAGPVNVVFHALASRMLGSQSKFREHRSSCLPNSAPTAQAKPPSHLITPNST